MKEKTTKLSKVIALPELHDELLLELVNKIFAWKHFIYNTNFTHAKVNNIRYTYSVYQCFIIPGNFYLMHTSVYWFDVSKFKTKSVEIFTLCPSTNGKATVNLLLKFVGISIFSHVVNMCRTKVDKN